MRCYASPYEGDKDFLFFSYCHDDETIVYPVIERLAIEGFRVWYDDGIHPGDDWPEIVAEHLIRARVCVISVSVASIDSHNCRREMTFAIEKNKPVLCVILEECQMTPGIQLQIGSSNYIRKFEYDQNEATFYEQLLTSPALSDCRDSKLHVTEEALNQWRMHVQEYQNERNRSKKVSGGYVPGSGGNNNKSGTAKASGGYVPGSTGKKNKSGTASGGKEDDDLTVYYDDDKTIAGDATVHALLFRVKKRELYLIKKDKSILGRGSSKADLVISGNKGISRQHAEIFKKGGRLYLRHIEEKNITVVDGKKVECGQEVQLADCSELMLGTGEYTEQFFLVYGSSCDCVLNEKKLCMLRSEDTGEIKLLVDKSFPLNRYHKWKQNVLGDQQISRENHAEIYRDNSRMFLCDTGSKNGTFYNGKRLAENESVELHSGDVISIVNTKFEYIELAMMGE